MANTAYDASGLRQVFERHFTWAAAFERNTHRYADRPALTDPASGRRWTYAELGALTGGLAAGLAARGVGVGDLVCYQLKNVPEFAFLYVAAQGLRAMSSPMNFRLAPAETAHILDSMRPAVYVYAAEDEAAAAAALELAALRPDTVAVVGGEPMPGAVRFEDLILDGTPSFRAPEGASTWDETSRIYTSGTTGLPKAVPMTSLNEGLTAHDVIMHFPLGPEDRTLNMSPWFHRGGNYCAGPNTMFFVGGEVVTLKNFDEEVVLDRVVEHGLSYLVGAPTNLERLADAQEASPRDLSSLRGIVTMGASGGPRHVGWGGDRYGGGP